MGVAAGADGRVALSGAGAAAGGEGVGDGAGGEGVDGLVRAMSPAVRRSWRRFSRRSGRRRETMSALDHLETGDPKFLPRLLALRADDREHAGAEERYEFIHIRRSAATEALASLVKGVRAAETMAPPRPHPGVESAAANVALGPVASLMDRTRDAVRKAMGRDWSYGAGTSAPRSLPRQALRDVLARRAGPPTEAVRCRRAGQSVRQCGAGGHDPGTSRRTGRTGAGRQPGRLLPVFFGDQVLGTVGLLALRSRALEQASHVADWFDTTRAVGALATRRRLAPRTRLPSCAPKPSAPADHCRTSSARRNGSIGGRLATTPRNPTANRQLRFTHVLPRTSQDSDIV